MERELPGAGARCGAGARLIDTVIAGLSAGGTTKPKPEFLPSDYAPALGDAFLAAYLLTASEELAEAAVREAIESWAAIDDPSVLCQLAVEAGLRRKPRNHIERGPARPWVPPELQRVLELSPPLRECFVLRILMELPRETCAILTAIDCETVDRYSTRGAVLLLGAHQTAALSSSSNCGVPKYDYRSTTSWRVQVKTNKTSKERIKMNQTVSHHSELNSKSKLFDSMLKRNRGFAAQQSAAGTLMPSLPRALPNARAVIIGCADMRVDPAHVLGIAPGEAVVMRNIGGRITPGFLEQLALLGRIGEVAKAIPGGGGEFHLVVLHHTDCGITRLARETAMMTRYFQVPETDLKAKAILDPRAAVSIDVATLRAIPALPGGWLISGLVYDVATGLVEVVVPPGRIRA